MRHNNTPKYIDLNLKTDDQIFIIFGTNIPDTTRNQMAIYVPIAPYVCFYTTCGKQNKQNITFLFNAISFF